MDEGREAATAAMWDGADYERLASRFAPAGHAVAAAVEAAGAPPGTVLDLAAGTGTVAQAMARQGRRVEATDIAPGLVATGRAQTDAQALDVRWRVAAMDDLDERGAYAAVTSSFGIIFSPEPAATLRRVHDALVPGGVVALSAWAPDGYVARMSAAMGARLSEPGRTAATAWVPWGDPAVLTDRLGSAGFVDVRVVRRRLPWRFASVDEAVDLLFEASPGHVAAARFSGDGAGLRGVVRAHLLDFAGLSDSGSAVDTEAAYVLASARRPVG
ncbi:class I SAM-dependent methyltransferase [Nocardioides sp. CFH 31398]|uniref:class I SAM-dependent methyltransferase n=1 Tax=Nocardioides sp. CFH 31398 TaxID=2919579 RepID=UPI001F068BF6|nr:class I SAM-dependent methyltransferase [Nocardioides sp. CFH 31398]MCH1867846.1 class I SAM-dependent methyltransferase [Nocardioides sp. CFH 31398]